MGHGGLRLLNGTPSTMCRTISTADTGYIIGHVQQAQGGDLCDLPDDIALLYTPLDPYNADQVLGAYGQDFAFYDKQRSTRKGRAKPKPKPKTKKKPIKYPHRHRWGIGWWEY